MNRRRSTLLSVGVTGLLCAFYMIVPASAGITGHAAVSSPLDSLSRQITQLRSTDRYEEAVPLARRLLDMQSRHPATRVWQITDTRRLIELLELVSTMPAPVRSALALADRLDDAIVTHYEHGEFGLASEAAKRQAALRREYMGRSHPDLVESLVSLAFTQWKLGDHSAAAHTAMEGLSIAEEIDAGHPRTGECLNVLGLANMASGNLDEAEECFRRALEIFREQTGEQSLEFTMVLENIGALYGEREQWALSEPHYGRCLSVNRMLLGSNHPDVARSLHNLGSCYLGQHDILRAEPLLEKALEIRTDLLGAHHPDVALTMHLLSDVYRVRGDYDRARALLENALSVRVQCLPRNHPQIAWNLIALSTLDVALGDQVSAYEKADQALALLAASDEAMQYARGLWYMGTLAWNRGDLVAVESYDRQIENILSDCNCGEFSRVLARSAAVQACYGHHATAESLLVVAADVYENLRSKSANVGQRVWGRVENPYRLLAAERLRLGETAEVWPTLERSLARAMVDQLALVDPTRDGVVSELDQVQESLGEKEAIIGWLDIKGHSVSWAWGYVMRRQGPVRWVELEAGDSTTVRPATGDEPYGTYAISEHAADLREGLRFAAAWPSRVTRSDRVDSHARELWHERMEPLERYLNGVSHLIVIPSSVMMGIPIEAMIEGSGKHVLERYVVSYVPSGTVYHWLEERRRERGRRHVSTALLVGNPALSVETVAESTEARDTESVHMAAGSVYSAPAVAVLRSALTGNPDALRALPRLEQSQREIASIASLLESTDVLLGAEASESNLRRLVERGRLETFDLVHFATHAIVDHYVPEMSSLVLSQLDRDEGDRESESKGSTDGLLNVQEIIRDWRLDAELVTLSACRTALGPEHPGEGYLGFAQAFLRAGAQSVIVSLWDVDDATTSLLMTRFYENLTGHHGEQTGEPMSSAEALREAKLWLRDYNPEGGVPPFGHPSYWSAFILIGESH